MANNLKIISGKAYACICLLLVFFFSLCACGVPKQSDASLPEEKAITALTLPISGGGLDIYTTASGINMAALTLCYNGLFYLDKSYTPQPDLAQDYKQEGTRVTIRLAQNALFSDGSPVTAQDCVYSFDKAKRGGNYSSAFQEIVSYYAMSQTELCVVFQTENKYNINLLCIPITKQNTDSEYAIGAGMYYIKSAPGENGQDILAMFPNNYREDMQNCGIKQITLRQYADISEILYGVNYGDIDVLTADLSTGAKNYRGDIELQSYGNNALTFVYVNRNQKWATNYAAVSAGLNCGIDRQRLYANVIKGCGTVCWYPLNPEWVEVADTDLSGSIFDRDAARQYFYEGRLYMSSAGKLQWYGEDVGLKIIVNRESELRIKVANEIASQLREYGFNAYVAQLSWNDYLTAIQTSDYDLYIGEIQIPLNMDISGLLYTTGAPIGAELQATLEGFKNNQTDIRSLLAAFTTEQPLIPLYYNNAALAANRKIKGTFQPSSTRPFGGIESWKR